MPQRLVAEYADNAAFIEAVETEVAHGGLLVRGARPGPDRDCIVELRVAGEVVLEVAGHIGSVARFGATVVFDEPPQAVLALAAQLKAAPADEAPVEEAPSEETPEEEA